VYLAAYWGLATLYRHGEIAPARIARHRDTAALVACTPPGAHAGAYGGLLKRGADGERLRGAGVTGHNRSGDQLEDQEFP